MSQSKHARFNQGDIVCVKDTVAAGKFGPRGKQGEVHAAAPGSAWVFFGNSRTGRDAWIPDEHLDLIPTA